MTKKDYALVAEGIKETLDRTPEGGFGKPLVAATARALGSRFAEDNPRFRADLFYRACGLNQHGGVA